MLNRTLLSFALLLTLSPPCRAQSAAETQAPEQGAAEAFAVRREAPLADLRALEGMSEVALAVEEVAPQSALDLLDALAETAAGARVTSEHGNPNFSPEAFARLAARDAGRVRSTAARLEDRLQRMAALAAAYRGEAEQLEKVRERNATRQE